MKTSFHSFDASKYLKSEQDMQEYLAMALEEGDAKTIQLVLRDIAKAKGMSKLAERTKLNRESLYKSLSKEGNPSFATILKVTKALGLKITLARQ